MSAQQQVKHFNCILFCWVMATTPCIKFQAGNILQFIFKNNFSLRTQTYITWFSSTLSAVTHSFYIQSVSNLAD